MTSLIAWIGVDSRGPSSVYLASDSRITWPTNGTWDRARKLFACSRYPHLLAYCGEVLFPSQTLGQITEMIDHGVLLKDSDSAEASIERIAAAIADAYRSYPAAAKANLEFLHSMRAGEGSLSRFLLERIRLNNEGKSDIEVIPVPDQSRVIAILGTGRGSIETHLARWEKSDAGGTSRASFSAFCDSLKSGDDQFSGGPPQLVGLWRKAAGKTFGMVWKDRCFFYGSPVDEGSSGDIRWYNELFEICDPTTRKRRPTVQPQPRPNTL